MTKALVSIIIPTYNRAHLIGETLDSVMAQTYPHWECIVVDDDSTDHTAEVLKAYCDTDHRIQYHQRPADRPKGANAARNYGFEMSKGDFIQWFDSDDLMTENHLHEKCYSIESSNCDFVVAQTQNFRGTTFLEPYEYSKQPYGITLEDFVLRKISWYTYDVMLARQVAEKISYNEQLMFWQDFNYFCKMLSFTTHGAYIDKVLTYRRLHHNSIQDEMTTTSVSFYQKIIPVMDLTYRDIHKSLNKFGKDQLIRGNMNTSFVLACMRKPIPSLKSTFKMTRLRFGYVSVGLFALSLMSGFVTKRGVVLLKKAKRN